MNSSHNVLEWSDDCNGMARIPIKAIIGIELTPRVLS